MLGSAYKATKAVLVDFYRRRYLSLHFTWFHIDSNEWDFALQLNKNLCSRLYRVRLQFAHPFQIEKKMQKQNNFNKFERDAFTAAEVSDCNRLI